MMSGSTTYVKPTITTKPKPRLFMFFMEFHSGAYSDDGFQANASALECELRVYQTEDEAEVALYKEEVVRNLDASSPFDMEDMYSSWYSRADKISEEEKEKLRDYCIATTGSYSEASHVTEVTSVDFDNIVYDVVLIPTGVGDD